MSSTNSKIISLTLPEKLLVQINFLAKREYTTRSDIVRQAALKYVREAGIDNREVRPLAPAEPKSARNILGLNPVIQDYSNFSMITPTISYNQFHGQ